MVAAQDSAEWEERQLICYIKTMVDLASLLLHSPRKSEDSREIWANDDIGMGAKEALGWWA